MAQALLKFADFGKFRFDLDREVMNVTRLAVENGTSGGRSTASEYAVRGCESSIGSRRNVAISIDTDD